jgi:hypothetical protein
MATLTEVPSQTCWTNGCDCDRCTLALVEPDPFTTCMNRLDELNAEAAS